jgi:cytoskeleton protein RodZ
MEHYEAGSPQGEVVMAPIGARLKAAREARGLGLGEVADRLKLSLRQLEAIEADNFSALPGATFVRGFVRNYARFLELDPEPLLRDLEASYPSSAGEVANLANEPQPRTELNEVTRFRTVWLGVVLVGVVVAGLSWWMVGAKAHRNEAAQEPPAENHLAPMLTEASGAAASAPVTSAPVAKAPVQASAPAASAPAAVAGKPMAASVPAAAAKPIAAAAAQAKPAPAAVPAKAAVAAQTASAPVAGAKAVGTASARIVAKGATWVEVNDANGQHLAYQLLPEGQEKTVSGTPPFKVKLGNATQVELYFNGKPVDFSSKIKGTTARLELE